LADAVIRIESRYNAGARNGPNLGLTQLNFRTAQSLGYTGEASGLFDAETNLRFGLKYLAQAYQLAGGDLCGAVLRYQGGHRAVTMTNASRAYCAKVKTIIAKAE
jgi:soluble lytic murein transglycosylase-like protein